MNNNRDGYKAAIKIGTQWLNVFFIGVYFTFKTLRSYLEPMWLFTVLVDNVVIHTCFTTAARCKCSATGQIGYYVGVASS